MLACDRCGSASLWRFTPPATSGDPTQADAVYLCGECRALLITTRTPSISFGNRARLAARRNPVDTEARPAPAATRHERSEREAPAERGNLVAVEHH